MGTPKRPHCCAGENSGPVPYPVLYAALHKETSRKNYSPQTEKESILGRVPTLSPLVFLSFTTPRAPNSLLSRRALFAAAKPRQKQLRENEQFRVLVLSRWPIFLLIARGKCSTLYHPPQGWETFSSLKISNHHSAVSQTRILSQPRTDC